MPLRLIEKEWGKKSEKKLITTHVGGPQVLKGREKLG